ncbi:hypothetical protein [Nonomuraea sp. NEAU-A123]|uniref:hypothetical protein n=1 Tax=Nonomuraea sp. NEAU-A123 TaxID=2839649 RepID=UPI001BE49FB2|nr:hypothetical protein [Nonomuraea sp. NEAU-A123]MBT2227909.1 hypothetical protein [Nonomuraea sp. NEAU-A123]
MRFVTVLVLLLAVCGGDEHAKRVAKWRLTYAGQGLAGGRWVYRPWASAYDRGLVAVGAKDDVWISEHGGPDDYSGSGLSHWDGRSWKPVRKPSPYGDLDQISRVAAPGKGEVWAVIHPSGPATVLRRGRVRMGHHPPAPAPGCPPSPAGTFFGMAARAHDDVWLVTQGGFERSGSCEVPDRGMVARWDGTAWRWLDQPPTASFIPTNGPSVVKVLPSSTRTVVAFSGRPIGSPGVTPGV